MKPLLFFIIPVFSFITIQCTNEIPITSDPIDLELGKVTLKIDKQNAPASVVLVEAFLTRENHDTLSGELDLLDSTSADILFEQVAAGEWHLKVNAKDNDGLILYTGETDLSVLAGIITQVNLTLVPTGNGTGSIYILVSWGTSSSEPWIKLNTSFQTDLHCIFVINSLVAYTGGEDGKIYKTINGGETWIDISPETNFQFSCIYFFNENIGWAGGKNGTLVKTINGGDTWEIMYLGGSIETNTVMSIYFSNENVGYVVGGNVVSNSFERYGYIFKTINGGGVWNQQLYVNYVLISESNFLNENYGFVAGSNGFMLNTSNGGNSWVDISINTGYWLGAIYFLNQSNGFVMGQSGFGAVTNNNGINWNFMTTGTDDYIEAISFRNELNGWAVAWNGSGSYTTNGGDNWNNYEYPTSNDLFALHFNNGFGMISGRNGTILKYNSNN